MKESQYPNIRICLDHFVKGQPVSLYKKDDLHGVGSSLRLGHAGVKEGTAAQERHSRSLERSRLREVFQTQETEGMDVETEGGEQEGIASQSVEKDVQTDVAGSDIDSLCHARLDAQDLTANVKYQVFDIERADADEARVSFYTGLPGHIVDTLADLVYAHI